MIYWIQILIFLLILLLIFWQFSTFISLASGIQYVYSKDEVVRLALKLANIKKGERFLELGSGIGNGLLIATSNFKVKATGVEISPFHYFISRIRTIAKTNIKITRGDFRNIDFKNFDVIYCYLCPKLMEILSLKFKKELPHGARVVSYCFEIPGLSVQKIKTVCGKKIYLYKF